MEFQIQCYYCKTDCAVTKETQKIWSSSQLKFVCKSCGFSGDNYDVAAAMARMTIARLTGRRNALVNQALSELQLLKHYNVLVPIKDELFHSTTEVDGVAQTLISMFGMTDEYAPLKTVGDGNCLYRAISLALSGTQDHHLLLRLITVFELIIFKNTYDMKKKDNNFLNDIIVVTSPYEKLVTDAIQECSFSEMAHIYAASAALGISMRTHFPPQKNELAVAFSRVVYGRDVAESVPPAVEIMWSSASVPQTEKNFVANHFVPLVRSSFLVYLNCVVDEETGREFVELESRDECNEVEIESDLPNESEDMTCNGSGSECAPEPGVGPESVIESDSDMDVEHDVTPGSPVNDETTGPLTHGFLTIDSIIPILKSDVRGRDYVPDGLKQHVYFILNNASNVESRKTGKKSEFIDDCGAWDASKCSTPKSHYTDSGSGFRQVYIRREHDNQYCYKRQVRGQVKYEPYQPQPDPESVISVHRYYTVSKKDNSYKKKATWISGSDLAVVEYIGKFPGLAPHGKLTRTKDEYTRLPRQLLDDITDMTDKLKPNKIWDKVTDKYDDLLTQPQLRTVHDRQYRDRQKNKDVDGHTDNFADQVRHLENLVTDKHPFVRTVIRTSGWTPSMIMFTDEQINDIKNLCCTGKAVLGVDKTFMLCKMHVTVTCFKQLSVESIRSGQSPIFLGPLFIHDNSDFETFSHFFYQLKLKLNDTPLSRLVIGSDDEKALVKAIVTVFPEATHVLCTRHLEDNARQMLTDDAVTLTQRKDILRKIFGKDGLMDADDSICYDNQAADIETDLTEVSEKFLTYFRKRLVTVIKNKVNDPQRHNKVIGHWTNNNCESMNHVLKQMVDWKSQPLPKLVKHVEGLVNGQYKKIRHAIVRTGDYRLTETRQHLERSKTDWTFMTDQQRTNHYRRVRHYVPNDDTHVTTTDGKTTVVAPRTNGRKPGQRKRKAETLSLKLKKN